MRRAGASNAGAPCGLVTLELEELAGCEAAVDQSARRM